MRQPVADIEDETQCYQKSHEDGEDKRQAVQAIVCPQCLELFTVVFLHHNGAQERRNEQYREQATDNVSPEMKLIPQELIHEWHEKSEHDGCDGSGKDAVDNRVAQHLYQ